MSMRKIRVAVFTSSRADYGLFRPLLKLLNDDPGFALSLLVGGSHLSRRFGYTKTEIETDGFRIGAEFDFLADPPEGDYLTRSLANLQLEIGAWLDVNRPDWIIVLGDRFELLAVAAAALLTKTPLAHISGGDITEGAIDNQVRHAVSKMAAIHFPATDAAKEVLLSLGEEEWRICLAGEPGLDQIATMDFMPRDALFAELDLDPGRPTAIVTFHPDTLTNCIDANFVKAVVNELLIHGLQIIATGSNFDAGGDEINAALENTENSRFKFKMSLGQRRYYSIMRYATLMVGNSSSGIVEAQSFNLPVIDVGSRQSGRASNANVLHVEANISAVRDAIPEALGEGFAHCFSKSANIYGDGQASRRIIAFLKEMAGENLLQKR
jgi:GDP/UDP-N,N'-diacetylbacillosamine 2-epimerase (hydrolysing)